MPINDSIFNARSHGFDSASQVSSQSLEPTILVIKDTIVNIVENSGIPNQTANSSTIDLNISIFLVISIAGLGVGLYFLTTVLKKYIVPIIAQRYQKHNIHLFWYRFTALLWLAFGLLALYIFLKASVLITSLVLLTTGLIFHHFIVDFLVGIYFQFENNLRVNDHFKSENMEGTVKGYYSRHLKIVSEDSEEIYIPYRNLLNTPIHIIKQVDSLIERQFTITLHGEKSQNLQLLTKQLVMCPWIYDKNLFKVKAVEPDIYQISLRVKEEFTANKIEAYVKSKLT